jgi:hypothetical protein
MTAVLAPSRAVMLLESRKAALEQMVRESFRVARETGKAADVSQLSASLRQVKGSLKAVAGQFENRRPRTERGADQGTINHRLTRVTVPIYGRVANASVECIMVL